jgi:hypothetical protein
VASPGVLGVRLAKTRLFAAELDGAERLVAYSDGISSRFDLKDIAGGAASEACRLLLATQRRAHDDATVAIVDLK